MQNKNLFRLILVAFLLSLPFAFSMAKKNVQTKSSEPTVWVGKSNQAKMCEADKGIALDSMTGELESAHIKVYNKKITPDGQMHMEMCGADKGDLNGFEIAKKDLDKAKALGFTLLNE